MAEEYKIDIFGDPALPTLVYLPGLHGDWTLIANFRKAVTNHVRLVEVTYPRTLTWSMEDYANELQSALLAKGVTRGWLLGESWGSQPAWALIGRNLDVESLAAQRPSRDRFKAQGLFLVGGFVKHPLKWGPAVFKRIGAKTSMRSYRSKLKIHRWYMRTRRRFAPDTMADLDEFAARRTDLDRQAMLWRLELLEDFDPRPIAERTTVPVHYLDGSIDPLVPWLLVRRWLRRNCPGYRGGKTFWLADHNLLATAPSRAAEWILRKMHEY